MRRTAEYSFSDDGINKDISEELKITSWPEQEQEQEEYHIEWKCRAILTS